MRKMKRFVSIILAATMLLTSMNALPFSSVAFADEPAGETTGDEISITWYDSTTDLDGDSVPDGLALNAAGTEIKTGVEVYTEVNAPIIENLKVYSTSNYTLHNLGTEFFGTNLLMRTTDQLAKSATESSNPHRRPVFYTETTADSGEALVSFKANKDGVLYALMNDDLSTYSTTTAGAAGEKWTKINNGVIPYGPDGTTKLDASKSYTITNTNLSETVYNAIAAATSKGGVNRTTNYAETITGGFLPTSSSDNNAHKYYATLTRTQGVSSSTDFFEAVQADYAKYDSANPSAYAPTSHPSFQYETSYDGAKSNPAYFPMKYVYKIEFNAGDIVKIPAIPYKYGINGTETLYTMPVFLVKWGNPDATLSTLSYTVDGETETVDGFDITNEGGTYDVTLEPGTKKINFNAAQTQTTKADMAITLADGTEIASGAEILLAPNKTKTVTVTVTAENGDVNTYTVNFVAPVLITWIEENNTYTFGTDTPDDATDDGTVTFWEYVEGDKFSPGDGIYVNRGGSEKPGETPWYATAVGNGLRGLDYIRGRAVDKAYKPNSKITSDMIKEKIGVLNDTTNLKPVFKFTASSAGVVYAVSNGAVANLTDASKQSDGIAWTALTADADGHTNNGTFDIDHTKQGDNYTEFTSYITEQAAAGTTVTDSLLNYLRWLYPKTATDDHPINSASFIKNETLWPNSLSVADKPYGFATVADEGAGLNPGQPKFGYAYKKEFAAGEEVTIPAWYAGSYSPMYFIEYKISDNAEIKSVSYTVNGAATPVTETPEFAEVSTGVYTAEVKLAFDATNISGITANPKDANATVTAISDFAFGETEFSKTVTTTVTSEDGKNTYTYNITFTRPKWDYTNTTFTVSDQTYYLAKYIEGDTFGPLDLFVMERGANKTGSEGSSKWYATAVGEKLRGLDYIVGRKTTTATTTDTTDTENRRSVTARDALNDLKDKGLPMMSFRADSDGFIYAVSNSSLNSVYVNDANVVGGVWESLDGKDGHTNGSFSPNKPEDWDEQVAKWVALDANGGNVASKATWANYLSGKYGLSTTDTHKQLFSDPNLWPHSPGVSSRPYAFLSVLSSTSSTNPVQAQYDFTYAYRKKFNKGDIVHIPSTGAINFVPVYFIDRVEFTDDTSAKEITVNGGENILADGVNDYKVTLAEADTQAVINVIPTDENATVTYTVDDAASSGTVEVADGTTETVTVTVTSSNGKCTGYYTIAVTKPYYIGGKANFTNFHTEMYSDGTKALIDYRENDSFSALDATNLDSSWKATDIGAKLKGDNLSYFIGRRTDGSSRTAQNAAVAALGITKPIFTFDALYDGTIYAISQASLDSTYLSGNVVGGAWTSLNYVDNHRQGNYDPDHTVRDDYEEFVAALAADGGITNQNGTGTITNSFFGYLNWKHNGKKADFFDVSKISETWPHNSSTANKTYGFIPVVDESSGINKQPAYTYAYKKVFTAGDPVQVPAFGTLSEGTFTPTSYSPVYIIRWGNPDTSASSIKFNDADIKSGDKITIAYNEALKFEVKPNHEKSKVAYSDMTVDEGETKTITATITAENGETQDYTVTVTRTVMPNLENFVTATYPNNSGEAIDIVTYVENDTFGVLDYTQSTTTGWKVTALGENLRKEGLTYFRTIRLDKAANVDNIKSVLADTENSLFSFKANKSGIIYAISNYALDSLYVTDTAVGGTWRSLDGVDGHVNEEITPSYDGGYTLQDDYDDFVEALAAEGGITNQNGTGTITDSFFGYLNWKHNGKKEDFFKAAAATTMWPHNASMSTKPYGFRTVASETSGIAAQPGWGYAYKKPFKAGATVEIPMHGSTTNYSPVYIIEWKELSSDTSALITFNDATIESGAAVTIEADAKISFVVTPNDEEAIVEYGDMTVEPGETKTITATVIAEDDTTQEYTVEVTRKIAVGDELITGFSYSLNDSKEKTTVTFADKDTDKSYSQVFDIWLDAGTTSVKISNITDILSIYGEEKVDGEYELVTPALTEGTTTVDVSGGKGTVEFYATYTKGEDTKTNYYIVRFFVKAPEIEDFEDLYTNETAKTKYQFVNMPLDNLSSLTTNSTLAVDTRSPYTDGSYQYQYPFAYMGHEIANSYLLVRHSRNQAGSYTSAAENTPEGETAPEYMYTFTAPADMKVIVAGYKNADSTSKYREANTDWKYVESSVGNDGLGTTQYTYKNTNFWHLANTKAKTHTYASGAITGATDGIPAIYTKPQDYLVSKPYASMHWVNADSTIQGAYKTYKVANPTEFEGTWADNKSNSLDWLAMVSAWKTAPTYGEKPLYVEANNFVPIGYQSPVGEIAHVYTQNFTSGSTVNIPYWYMTAKTGGENRNPVIYVQYGYAFSDDATAKKLTFNTEEIDLDTTEAIEKTVEEGSKVTVALTPADYDATVKYTVMYPGDETATEFNGVTEGISEGTAIITAQVVAEDGTLGTAYTFTITAKSDALIKGFKYRVGDGEEQTVNFIGYDLEPLYLQYFDVDVDPDTEGLQMLPAGTKSVTVTGVIGQKDNVTYKTYDGLTCYNGEAINVDVSTGKGEIIFEATSGEGEGAITNKYIARFMVDSYDFAITSPMTKGWTVYNKPFDYFSGTSLFTDRSTWNLGQVGSEIQNSYLLIRPVKDVYASATATKYDKESVYLANNTDKTAADAAAAEYYMYSFTAPADGVILLASSADTAIAMDKTTGTEYVGNIDEIAAAGFVKVMGNPVNVNELNTYVTDYTYTHNSFWHKAGTELQAYTKSGDVITKRESFDGVTEIITKPYDHQVTAVEDIENYGAENYYVSSYHIYDNSTQNAMVNYKKQYSYDFEGTPGTANAAEGKWVTSILKSYRDDPTIAKPAYIEANECAAPGLGATYVTLGTVYKKAFKAGEIVNIPFYYAKPGSGGYNPVVFVQWKDLDTNVGELAEASLKADISGSNPREVAIENGEEYPLGYNDTSLTLHFATNNHKDFIKYEITYTSEGETVTERCSNVITPTEDVPEMTVTVTIMSEAAAAGLTGGETETYTFTVSKAVDKTDYGTAKNISDTLVIEAENVVVNNTTTTVADGAVTLNGTVYTDDTFVNKKNNTIAPEAPGDMGFNLAFDEVGAYTIWVRYKADGAKSAWVDYGEVAARTAVKGYGKSADGTATTFANTNGDYKWKAIQYMHGAQDTTKKIRIRTCETGLTIDKFVITRYLDLTTYTPNNDGTLPANVSLVATFNPDDAPDVAEGQVVPTPPASHPRVLFTAADIPQIKKNLLAAENAALVSAYESKRNDTAFDGKLANKEDNYNAEKLEIIAAKAFDYAIFKDDADETVKARALANGNAAIELIKNYAATLQVDAQGDNCRQKGHVLKNIGQVYDWCYDLLDADDKKELMYLAQMLSAGMEIGFPPNKQGILSGHGAEWQVYRDWLTMAIATYGDYSDVYNFIAPNVYSAESVSYRNWWYQSGTQSQGTSYGPGRLEPELYAHVLIKKMGGGELFNEEAISNVPFEWIYRRRPDGQMMIDGDDNTPNTTKFGNYAYNALSRDVLLLAYTLNGDEILKQEYIKQGGLTATYGREAIQPVEALILNKPSIKTNTPKNTLPLTTYHAYPVGEMVARTGWDIESGVNSKDVIATMTLNATNPTNHGHYEAGHFMIYYKGILANDSGWYEEHNSDHHKNYMSQSVAHNTLAIETPSNPYGNQNQNINGEGYKDATGRNFYWIPSSWEDYQTDTANDFAEIMGHEFGPDAYEPEYTYLAGDLADSYTNDDDTYVEEALRHMIFLPTGNEEYPAAFVVFDKVKVNAEQQAENTGLKKKFLLHSQQEPTVESTNNGLVTTITRTDAERGYNGKLVNRTLALTGQTLAFEKIGGANLIEGTGKVTRADSEGNVIETKAAMPDNRFNNKGEKWLFMQDNPEFVQTKNTASRVVDPDNSLEAGWGRVEIMPAASSATDYMLNVMYVTEADNEAAVQTATKIESGNFIGAQIFDRVVMFNTAKARTAGNVTFTIPTVSGYSNFKVNVAGLAAGAWTVTDGAEYSTTKIVSKDGGILYFDKAPAGTYTLTKTNATLTLKINGVEYVGDEAILAAASQSLESDVETINLVLESTAGAEVTYTVDDAAVAEVKDIPAPLMGSSKTVTATVDGATYTFIFTRGTLTAPVTIAATTGGTFNYEIVGGASSSDELDYVGTVNYGTVYNLTAVPNKNNGYTFQHWKIGDYIVSEDTEYTYTANNVSNNASNITAVFAKNVVDDEDITEKLVIFKNRNGKILGEYTLNENSDPINVTVPVQNGYTFEGWLRKDSEEGATAAKFTTLSFSDEALDGAETIVFEAQYSKATTKYEVVVNNGYIYYANDVAVGNTTTENAQYEYNTPIIVRPTDESNFSYWIKDDRIASYSPTYKFHVTTAASTTLKAVYDGTEGEEAKPKPFISVTNLVLDENNTKIRFYTERYVPTDYIFVGAGLTVTKDKPGLGNCNNLSGSGIYQWTSKNPNARQFVGTKANIGTGHTWYAKAWLMYKKPDSDHIYTIYSTEESITY